MNYAHSVELISHEWTTHRRRDNALIMPDQPILAFDTLLQCLRKNTHTLASLAPMLLAANRRARKTRNVDQLQQLVSLQTAVADALAHLAVGDHPNVAPNYSIFVKANRQANELACFTDAWARLQSRQLTAAAASDRIEPRSGVIAVRSRSAASPPQRRASEARRRQLERDVLALAQRHPTAPLELFFQSTVWSQGPFGWVPMKQIRPTVLALIGRQCATMSVGDFAAYYKRCEPQHLRFGSWSSDVGRCYYDLERSVAVMDELLQFQFDADPVRVRAFLRDLYGLCNRERDAKNAMLIVAPTNGGKSFFFDAVVDYFRHVGRLGNRNAWNRFPMEACVGRRIILWDEPVLEPAAGDTVRSIFGGRPTHVRLGRGRRAIVERTPVVVLSSRPHCFAGDAEFRSNVSEYAWKMCPALKRCEKRPWPVAFYALLQRYNVVGGAAPAAR